MIGDPYIESGMSDLEYYEQVCGHWWEEEEPECPRHPSPKELRRIIELLARKRGEDPRVTERRLDAAEISAKRKVVRDIAREEIARQEDLPEDQCPF
jgi:hypothetical protein